MPVVSYHVDEQLQENGTKIKLGFQEGVYENLSV